MDIGTFHLTVTHKEACRRKGCQSASYNVCALFIDAFRLLRPCKRLIIAVCIVNSLAVFFVVSTLGVAIF